MSERTLGLVIPAQDLLGEESFNIDARQMARWLEELPRANLGETSRLVYHALRNTNRQSLPYADRLRFLDEMREPVHYVCDTLKKHFVGTQFPLPEKNRKVATATREIYNTMAVGYKIVIEELLAKRRWLLDKKLLAKLIHRATYYSGRVLLTVYQTYAPYPDGLWREIYQLYKYAEGQRLLDISVQDSYYKDIKKSDIAAEFNRTLLLYLTSPYRLRQGEAGKVYDTLERWSSHCHIIKPTPQCLGTGQFGFNLDTDVPPRSLSLSQEHCTDEHCRLLNTDDLANTLRLDLQSSVDFGSSTITSIEMMRPELSNDLIRRLLIAWGMANKRGFPRNNKNEQVYITLGLSATHQIIAEAGNNQTQSRARTTQFTQSAKYQSNDIKHPDDVQPDVWDLIYPTKDESASKEVTTDKVKSMDESSQIITKYYEHVETWAILNESANGYCLNSDHPAATNIQVGELIGIRRGNNGHSWKWGIGTVRWMRLHETDGLRIGIEMLTPDAAAIGIKVSAQNSIDTGEYKRTLLLPEITVINQPATLITPPVPYRSGNKLTIKILGKLLNIELTKMLQNTGMFAQFQFNILENDTKTQASTTSPDSDFDNIWSSI